MISASTWIRKGAAKVMPERFEMTEEQYQEILSRAQFEISEAKVSLKVTKEKKSSFPAVPVDVMEDDLAKFDLNTYNDNVIPVDDTLSADEYDNETILDTMTIIDEAALGINDPYLKTNEEEKKEEEEEEDLDDLCIDQQYDSLLVTCRTEDEVSYLEVHVYEEDEDNLYTHHDIMLPSFPLCVEWIGTAIGVSSNSNEMTTSWMGNFAAVGTFDPEIEIWNLNVLETPYPAMILGQDNKQSKGSNKKIKEKKSSFTVNAERHTDSVMTLSWNKLHQTLLLSGSADTTVKLWDLSSTSNGGGGGGKCIRNFSDLHTDKVQTVQWNHHEASLLASAGYDRKISIMDCRMPNSIRRIPLQADPECLRWNPHNKDLFVISDEDGRVIGYDLRMIPSPSLESNPEKKKKSHPNTLSSPKPLFTLQAHEKAVTSVDWNPVLPNCLLTFSADKSMKLWNIGGNNNDTITEISCFASRDYPTVGKIFTGSFSPDMPNLVCVAGSRGILKVVNLFKDSNIVEAFQKLDQQSLLSLQQQQDR